MSRPVVLIAAAGSEALVLEVKHVSKEYPGPAGPVPVLSDVSLTLSRGESASIMGPSGSGKSTLLYLLGALEPPTTGSITLDGDDPFQLSERDLATFRNTRVGFVFQDHLLLPQCTVLENVLLPTLVSGGGHDAAERAHALLNDVGLRERIDHRPAELSGGERQRVALARALIRQPLLLLCDEPTGNLDEAAGERVASVLFNLHAQQNTILIIVTHNAGLAAQCAAQFRLRGQRLEPR